MTTPPAQRLAPGVVLLTGPAVDAARHAVAHTRSTRYRRHLPDLKELADLAAALEPVTAQGHSDIGDDTGADTELVELITIDRAAQLLGCSPRQARRLAPKLGGTRIGGRWLIDTHAIHEHLHGKA